MNYFNKSKYSVTINEIIMKYRGISGAVHVLLLTGGYQSSEIDNGYPSVIPVCPPNTRKQDSAVSAFRVLLREDVWQMPQMVLSQL